ncbi:PREDICTED: slit homolog 3 protein-like [Branchiostoma belcheri]|uniref:Slit homolog 3 protein-like n=1 Tax=Branchiostoma belcheri TaxID=7741 RepID=A0A6P4XHT8_BRABE|nr:PREDICTED: slit homolog 3 protein-like [Branchiostoma belcheri]
MTAKQPLSAGLKLAITPRFLATGNSYRSLEFAFRVDCNNLGLVAVPVDIPSNAARFDIAHNNIRNVTYLPPLPKLITLDLRNNSIETVSWMALTLPALNILLLQGNQLKYVKIGVVLAHLPKLVYINLSMNKLVSFSQYELEWPPLFTVAISKNPFHCDCDLSWLIIKMTCLKACKGDQRKECCSSCSACFLHMPRNGMFYCSSPTQLRGRHLSTVSTELTHCGTTHINGSGTCATQTHWLFMTKSNIKHSYENDSSVDCNKLGLVAVPVDIPSDAGRFYIAHNNIRNVTYLPPLPKLITLDLRNNSIETVSWMALTLPALNLLLLQGNQLKYVKIDVVLAHLPKLIYINLSMNKLVSFSQYELEWPPMFTVAISNNPFHCDCELSWLIIKMTCLKACKGDQRKDRCSSCSACFLHMPRNGMFNCSSPSQLRGRHLSTVSAELTHCGTTHINGSGTCATQTHWLFMTKSNIKHSYENDSSVTIPKSESLVTTSASTTGKSSNTKEENSHKYITVIVACLTVAFLACSVLLTIKKRLCCKWHNRREAAGIGADRHAINSHQIVPPIESNVCNETVVAEGSNPRQPVAHQIALPIENTVNQCTSTQGMDDEDSVPPGENQSTPSPETNTITMTVSEQCVEYDFMGVTKGAIAFLK